MKPNPVVHFEMGYEDKERMCTFYENAFGWKLQRMGPDMGDYVVAQTAETDEKGMIQMPGAINGGFYKKTDNPLSHAPSVVIAVDDIRGAMKKAEEAGGKILGSMNQSGEHTNEPQEIPGVGLWVSMMDTENNRFSILQPNQRA
jgi:predicted enzyme related to lactoylglutathione lyase